MPTLLGPDGRPIPKSDLSREIATASLTGIRRLWYGEIRPALTPQRLATILREASEGGDITPYYTLAEEMEEREPHYASVLSTRKLAVSGLEARVEAATDAGRDVAMADAVRSAILKGEGFRGLLNDAMDALGKGISVIEIGWDTRTAPWAPRPHPGTDNKRIAAYSWRDPRFFMWDRETGQELRLRDEQDLMAGLPMAPYKFIVHQSRLKTGLPGRSGLARLVAVSYMCKTYALEDWLAFAEVFGMPMRIGRYGPGAKEEDINTLISAVANLGSDAAAVLPESMRIEFQAAAQGAGGPNLFQGLSEWLDKQVSKAVLGQTASADETPGKLGGSNEKEEVRRDRIRADAEQLADTLNAQLVRPFVDLNFGPQKQYPLLSFYIPEPEDLGLLVTAMEKLVPLGLEVEQSVIRDKFGLPDPDAGAKLLGAKAPEPPPVPQQEAPSARNRAMNRAVVAQPDEIDTLAADALLDWEPMMRPAINPIQDLADSVDNVDDFLAGLAGLLPKMDLTRLIESLAKAAFKSRGMGDAEPPEALNRQSEPMIIQPQITITMPEPSDLDKRLTEKLIKDILE